MIVGELEDLGVFGQRPIFHGGGGGHADVSGVLMVGADAVGAGTQDDVFSVVRSASVVASGGIKVGVEVAFGTAFDGVFVGVVFEVVGDGLDGGEIGGFEVKKEIVSAGPNVGDDGDGA